MIDHLLFGVAVLVAGLLFALLEIQIEGGHGWASALPTWRNDSRWARLLLGGRSLTGYHLYIHLFLITMAHAAYVIGPRPFSWATEARVVAFLTLFWVVEDFLWFALNPAFGLARFRPEHIPWHCPSWWWIMPREYWIAVPAGVALYVLGA